MGTRRDVLVPPADPQRVGWWGEGAAPGERGRALVAGHTVHTGGGALDDLETLEPGDRVLFCGTDKANNQMQWSLRHLNALRYVQTGHQRPDGLVWRWLAKRRAAPADVRE